MQTLTPPQDLYARIIDRVTYEQEIRSAKRRLYAYGASLAVLMVSFVPFFESLYDQVQSSGLPQFLGLLSTDFSTVTSHAGDYTMSLLEAVPVLMVSVVAAILIGITFALVKGMRAWLDVRVINSNFNRLT
jgi:ABC-type nitrate/sulfonate/bicarbonate transport system permease component